MSEKIQAIRGMHDILPEHSGRWQYVEAILRRILSGYGYFEIRLPLVEKTALFKRAIGEVTDIVEKEMYTFEDRNGDSLTLRPEGTAGCLRACLEHGLLHNQTQRMWYLGPMFRHERPQKGRYRQFYQLGVEAYGMAGPDIDAELILLSARLWRELGIGHKLVLQLNSLGTTRERLNYRTALVDYLREHYAALDEDSRRRLETNPLRILDSKNPDLAAILAAAPSLHDALGDESRAHFERLKALLDAVGIAYTINPRLVRGLDYYTLTVFEWVTREPGAQGTVCAGGRYDGLVTQLGGRESAAIGFALGMERLIDLLDEPEQHDPLLNPQAYLVLGGDEAACQGLRLAEQLREALPDLRLVVNGGGGSFKTQFRRADKMGAAIALVLGDDEAVAGTVGIKSLREAGQAQVVVPQTGLINHLKTLF